MLTDGDFLTIIMQMSPLPYPLRMRKTEKFTQETIRWHIPLISVSLHIMKTI